MGIGCTRHAWVCHPSAPAFGPAPAFGAHGSRCWPWQHARLTPHPPHPPTSDTSTPAPRPEAAPTLRAPRAPWAAGKGSKGQRLGQLLHARHGLTAHTHPRPPAPPTSDQAGGRAPVRLQRLEQLLHARQGLQALARARGGVLLKEPDHRCLYLHGRAGWGERVRLRRDGWCVVGGRAPSCWAVGVGCGAGGGGAMGGATGGGRQACSQNAPGGPQSALVCTTPALLCDVPTYRLQTRLRQLGHGLRLGDLVVLQDLVYKERDSSKRKRLRRPQRGHYSGPTQARRSRFKLYYTRRLRTTTPTMMAIRPASEQRRRRGCAIVSSAMCTHLMRSPHQPSSPGDASTVIPS